MVRIAIVEDEMAERETLVRLLRHYGQTHRRTFEIDTYADGMDLLEEYACQYDIVFLDVQMKFTDGLTAAQRIRRIDQNVLLYFVTSYAQHATDGYDVDAKGFILKPVSLAVFERQLDRAMRYLEKKGEKYLVLQNSREMQRIPLSSILYIESLGHYIKVHTVRRTGTGADRNVIIAHSTMKETEEKLRDMPFYRCSNSTIINLQKVDAVRDNTVLLGDDELTVSRARKKNLMAALNRYLSDL